MKVAHSKLRVPIIAAMAILAILGIAIIAKLNSPGWQFSRKYKQLQLGMTQDQVRNLFNDTPDFDCLFKSSTIWYFKAPDFLAGDFNDVDLVRGSRVDSLSDLPDVYDHVQLAFDSKGNLHAYTLIGEELSVQSTSGSVPGSHFKVLNSAQF